MTPRELLWQAEMAGLTLRAEGESLAVKGPKSVRNELRAELSAHKQDLLELLDERELFDLIWACCDRGIELDVYEGALVVYGYEADIEALSPLLEKNRAQLIAALLPLPDEEVTHADPH